jgi:uncharacterized repeat protein (TIGR03803 family)
MSNTTARRSLLPTAIIICLLSIAAPAQTFTVLYSFNLEANSQGPTMGLVSDSSGNLFGTTFGLLDGGKPRHYGSVFKLNAAGSYATLKKFSGPNGANPLLGRLTLDAAGNLYGLTESGGANGSGTVYELDSSGKQTVLYSFTGARDGGAPRGSIVRDAKGNIFGTTFSGGTGTYGTVFKVNANGKETVLHNFGAGDGKSPSAGLIADSTGNLYGLTTLGGSSNAGAVFKITKSGKETILYSFTGAADGGIPSGEPLLDKNGNLYGTTLYGGAHNVGTVFKLDPAGTLTVLHTFDWPATLDGAEPAAGLVSDASGNLYGTTWAGGAHTYGTVYKIDPAGNFTLLHSFKASEGSPTAALILDSAGNLYGTTRGNPVAGKGFGVVYKIVP